MAKVMVMVTGEGYDDGANAGNKVALALTRIVLLREVVVVTATSRSCFLSQ